MWQKKTMCSNQSERLPFFSAIHTTKFEEHEDSVYLPHPKTPLWLFTETDSTLNRAAQLAAQGRLPVWSGVLAETQSGGRGQLGRSWVSPRGNIYATMRLPYIAPFNQTAAAPAVGGLLAEAFIHSGLCSTHGVLRIKWPNDLVFIADTHDTVPRKVGGILLEERKEHILVGIGLNVATAPHDVLMRKDAAMPAGCLPVHMFSNKQSLVELWLSLAESMYTLTEHANFIHSWQQITEKHLAFIGQHVYITDGSEEQQRIEGTFEGLEANGALRVRCGGQTLSLTSGTLRIAS